MTDLALTVNVSDSGIVTFNWRDRSAQSCSSVPSERQPRTRCRTAAYAASRYRCRLKIWLLGGRCCAQASGWRGFAARRSSGRTVRTAMSACSHGSRPTRRIGPHGFSGVMNSALPKKRLIAHVLLRDPAGRVLLCETQFKTDWELPGGIVEPYETPRQGAIREVTEELGIELAVGRLLVVDWMPPYLGWDDAIEMIFDGGLVDEDDLAAWSLQPTEIKRGRTGRSGHGGRAGHSARSSPAGAGGLARSR